ncbi:cytochrome C oxidase subunit IV [Halomonas campisalis]|uniref:Cytochrome C oxidase subunit IV n=1 Tax=Billgrantia campisalis TaxID=74661 RepID=A0ABS9P5I8_9GAMM|nr:cytochrome C oxidase subunit IV family protein [Halomonas campisalis]MCG6657024.1 cytochrome C oxidase subunit IV [Halomonas campisalis]MDR5862209.1 cytochrome C oxidase subunit IV family protein [Halomonas campisalis]
MAHDDTQQHPLRVYLWAWLWLFILSVLSYLVDISGIEGLLKWSLITLFMLLKAGLIVAFFMHMIWERLAIIYTVLIPPGVLLFLAGLMALESNYTLVSRLTFFAN